MGLLSFLQLAPFQMQPDQQWTPQQQQPTPVPQSPLQRFRPMQAPQTPQAQQLGPLQSQMQAQPSTQVSPIRAPNFTERFDTLTQSPMFNMGLSLLGNAQNGGNWGQVARDMQTFRQQQLAQQQLQRQNTREDRQDARQDTIFGRQQQMWGQEDQQIAAWRAAIQGEQDPTRRAMLEAIGPQGYGEWMSGEQQRAFQADQAERDRETTIRAAGISAGARDRPRPMTPQFRTQVRAQFETANQLRESYQNFLEMVRNADSATLMGVGPRGAELAAAQRLLAIQAKSPAALDLGALVGADFAILDDIIGNPQNWRQLVQSGGREGVLQRLRPFDTFMNQGAQRLRGTYQDYADQFPEYYQTQALPTTAPPPSQQSGGGGGSYGNQLPDPSGFPEGHRLQDDSGAVVVLRNGRWVPEPRVQGRFGASRPVF